MKRELISFGFGRKAINRIQFCELDLLDKNPVEDEVGEYGSCSLVITDGSMDDRHYRGGGTYLIVMGDEYDEDGEYLGVFPWVIHHTPTTSVVEVGEALARVWEYRDLEEVKALRSFDEARFWVDKNGSAQGMDFVFGEEGKKLFLFFSEGKLCLSPNFYTGEERGTKTGTAFAIWQKYGFLAFEKIFSDEQILLIKAISNIAEAERFCLRFVEPVIQFFPDMHKGGGVYQDEARRELQNRRDKKPFWELEDFQKGYWAASSFGTELDLVASILKMHGEELWSRLFHSPEVEIRIQRKNPSRTRYMSLREKEGFIEWLVDRPYPNLDSPFWYTKWEPEWMRLVPSDQYVIINVDPYRHDGGRTQRGAVDLVSGRVPRFEPKYHIKETAEFFYLGASEKAVCKLEPGEEKVVRIHLVWRLYGPSGWGNEDSSWEMGVRREKDGTVTYFRPKNKRLAA